MTPPDRETAATTDPMTDRAGTDSGLLAPTWAGSPAEAAATDEAFLQAMLDVEVALARAQAAAGVLPASAATAIAAAARADRLDLVELARRARNAANPVVAFVPAFTALVAADAPEAAEYVHRGSTSQDILDSAYMLVARRVLGLIAADLERVARALATLAGRHRDTVQAGRTLTQHAVPVTFGLKAATWLQLTLDALSRVRATVLPAELGGAAGTLAAYAEYGAVDRPGEPFDATDADRPVRRGARPRRAGGAVAHRAHADRRPRRDADVRDGRARQARARRADVVPHGDRRGERARRTGPGRVVGHAAEAQPRAGHPGRHRRPAGARARD